MFFVSPAFNSSLLHLVVSACIVFFPVQTFGNQTQTFAMQPFFLPFLRVQLMKLEFWCFTNTRTERVTNSGKILLISYFGWNHFTKRDIWDKTYIWNITNNTWAHVQGSGFYKNKNHHQELHIPCIFLPTCSAKIGAHDANFYGQKSSISFSAFT